MDKTVPVRRLIDGWAKLDLDYLLGQFAEDAIFENIPMEPIVGKPAIRAALKAFLDLCEAAPWTLINIAVSEQGNVLTERDDVFHLRDGRRVNCPVMGVLSGSFLSSRISRSRNGKLAVRLTGWIFGC